MNHHQICSILYNPASNKTTVLPMHFHSFHSPLLLFTKTSSQLQPPLNNSGLFPSIQSQLPLTSKGNFILAVRENQHFLFTRFLQCPQLSEQGEVLIRSYDKPFRRKIIICHLGQHRIQFLFQHALHQPIAIKGRQFQARECTAELFSYHSQEPTNPKAPVPGACTIFSKQHHVLLWGLLPLDPSPRLSGNVLQVQSSLQKHFILHQLICHTNFGPLVNTLTLFLLSLQAELPTCFCPPKNLSPA